MTAVKSLHVSASALKSLETCSYAFYLERYLKLPTRTWPRTSLGSLSHTILELLRLEKHRAHYEAIKSAGSTQGSPAITRLIRILQYRYQISDELIADIDPMVMLVIYKTNFLDEGATQTFPPEHEFKLSLTNGATIKGFIDRLAIYGEGDKRHAVISDFKSQGQKFSKKDLDGNIQASIYQLYVYKTFGIPATVEFIMLRHPPTSRSPQKHLQIVPPATPAQLAGLEYYLEHMYQVFQNFGLKEAYQSFNTDYGFCKNVCSFSKPFKYYQVTDKNTGALIANFALDKVPQLKENETGRILEYKGCPNFSQ